VKVPELGGERGQELALAIVVELFKVQRQVLAPPAVLRDVESLLRAVHRRRHAAQRPTADAFLFLGNLDRRLAFGARPDVRVRVAACVYMCSDWSVFGWCLLFGYLGTGGILFGNTHAPQSARQYAQKAAAHREHFSAKHPSKSTNACLHRGHASVSTVSMTCSLATRSFSSFPAPNAALARSRSSLSFI
jgi:hypothetical protein